MFDGIVNELRLIWRLMLDARVPFWKKLIPITAVIYVISPLDLIPDILIGIGQLDDLGILLGSLRLFKSSIPEYILKEHREILAGNVIDVRDYEVIDRD
jgi:uncharacterized membrane protein YkvA (DUF1232 family)